MVWDLLTVLEVNNATLAIGGMAAIGTLIGNFLTGETFGDGVGLVDWRVGWGPDGLPGLSLGGGSHCCWKGWLIGCCCWLLNVIVPYADGDTGDDFLVLIYLLML